MESLEKSHGENINNLNLADILSFPDEKLSEDARLIKNYFIRLIRHMPNNVYWVDKNGITLGCNDNVLKFVGVKKLEDVVGKSYEELAKVAGWTEEQAMSFKEDDQEVIRTGKAKINVEEPVFYDKQGNPIYYLSSRIPLYDDSNQIIGIVGISVDIANQKQKEQLEVEMGVQKKLIEEQKKNKEIIDKYAHDVRSPVSGALMILEKCTELPDDKRVPLRNALTRIGDMTKKLLSKYNKLDDNLDVLEEREAVLVSAVLLDLLAEKRFEYENLSVKFEYDFKDSFSFISIEPNAFRRSLSNLINNAIDAFDGKKGIVTLRLESMAGKVQVIIQDNGKGMSQNIMDKITSDVVVTEGKQGGFGIGWSQIRQTLKDNDGEFKIESMIDKGTKIILGFPKVATPTWSTDGIVLGDNDILVILDDEDSIKEAWRIHLAPILKDVPGIEVVNFKLGQEALDYINGLSSDKRLRVFLLTDYELVSQSLNGLDVIEKSKVKRSLLVTSHYGNLEIQSRAVSLGTKILSKQLADTVPITIDRNFKYLEKNEPKDNGVFKKVDIIIVDDDEEFANNVKNFLFSDKKVDCFNNPIEFLEVVSQYSKDTKICLDNNFVGVGSMKGIEFAEQLHKLGYTKLYMLSGDNFKKDEIPSYLTAILKTDIDSIEKIQE